MRRVAVVASIALVVFAWGCQKKSEPPAGEGAAGSAAQAGAPTLTFTKTATDTCINYNPDILTVGVGMGVNFNNSAADTVWVTAPAGCFSAAETTFAVLRGNNGRASAYHTGTYNLTTRPAACAKVTGGTGPSVVVDSGTSGGKK
jgi:plastocyanin